MHVVDETGAPVPSLKLSARTGVRQVVYQNGAPFGEGAYEVSATTGMDGWRCFNGLPIYAGLVGLVDDSFTVSVPPTKVMGTEIYDFLGASFPFHLNGLVSSAQVIHLAGPNTALSSSTRTSSTCAAARLGLADVHCAPSARSSRSTGPSPSRSTRRSISSSLRAEFLDADGKLTSTTADGHGEPQPVVSITPSVPLGAGKRYNLILHAVAATTAGTVGGAGAARRHGAVLLAAAERARPSPSSPTRW